MEEKVQWEIVKLPDIPTPRTLEQAKKISEFLFAELDDWVTAEYAKAQDRFGQQYVALKDDAWNGLDFLLQEFPSMPHTWYEQKIRWLLRSRGEIFLKLQEQRMKDIYRIQMETIDAISVQWERWIREIAET